jgi:hypothetical protein
MRISTKPANCPIYDHTWDSSPARYAVRLGGLFEREHGSILTRKINVMKPIGRGGSCASEAKLGLEKNTWQRMPKFAAAF